MRYAALDVGRHFHPLRREIHLLEGINETAGVIRAMP
jgi:hypothetical protein